MKEFIVDLIKKSGVIAVDGAKKKLNFFTKENQSHVVTKVDFEIEKFLISKIEERFPTHNIIGEEMGYKYKKSAYTWLIDPIDGTSNYIDGLPWFGSIIVLLKDWKPVEAVIYLPMLDDLYYAIKYGGSFLNNKKITTNKKKNLKNCLVSYGIDYNEDRRKTRKEAALMVRLVSSARELRMTNSVYDFCCVACGKYGAFIRQSSKIWDVAGPSLLVEEAGGITTRFNGKDLNFFCNKRSYLRNFSLITASNRIIYGKIRSIVSG